jgi:hypothetical protein
LPSLLARLTKIKAMSAAEIAERIRYSAYCAGERVAHRRGRLNRADRLRRALTPALGERADWQTRLLTSRHERQHAFFAGTSERVRMRELFEREYRCEREAAIEVANRILGGEVAFFGQTFHVGADVAWNRDPVNGAEWPRVYHRDVPMHGSASRWGDIKYVWELNRQQFLIDLGRASFLTGDPRYAARARALVADWIDDNPYATGVNWSCALEPAFRALSWLWAYYSCLDQEHAHADHHLLWLTGFYDHGRFLHRHLEHYTSPFNHLVGEACALYMLGMLFPEFREADAWRHRGRKVLESRLQEQFYADGGSVEQSTFYHHATLGFYLLAAVLGKRHGEAFSADVWNAIERAISFAAALVQPDGTTPSIGGADDGKPLRMEHVPLWDFRPFQAIGSVLFERPDFKHVAGRFFEDALWLLGPDGLARFGRLSASPPGQCSTALRQSGYYVLRSDWSEQADYVCIDCGEQAGGLRTDAVPNTVHGHADCLSIVVWLGGQRLLVDSGLFSYNGDAEWVAHFRGTAAHNTARIDGRDQALNVGPMAWSHSYTPRPELVFTEDRLAFMGSHDGFTRREGDAVHRRLVWLHPGAYLIIYDELECRRDHDLELAFQFAPGDLFLEGNDRASYGNGIHCVWTASTPLTAHVNHGGARPDEGWIAPSLGVRVPAPRLTLSGRIGHGAATLTVITAPRASDSVDVGSERPGVVRVKNGDVEDYVCAPAIAKAVMPGDTDGKVAIWRLSLRPLQANARRCLGPVRRRIPQPHKVPEIGMQIAIRPLQLDVR